jgi:chromosomal replication initiation ATPase DnaA
LTYKEIPCPWCRGTGRYLQFEDNPSRDPTIVALMEWAASKHGVQLSAVLTGSRRRRIVAARDEVIRALYQEGLSRSQIGRVLHRDHSTILHSLRKMKLV